MWLFPVYITATLWETNSFMATMQLINPNYPWKNRVNQIKAIQNYFHKDVSSASFLKNQTLKMGWNAINISFLGFTTNCNITEWVWAQNLILWTCVLFWNPFDTLNIAQDLPKRTSYLMPYIFETLFTEHISTTASVK